MPPTTPSIATSPAGWQGALAGNSRTTRLLVTVALPLLAGGLIYLLWRTPDGWIFRAFEQLGLSGAVAAIQQWAGAVKPRLPWWFLYSLPDGLWVFAGTSWMALIWSGSRHRRAAALWIALCPALAVGGEVAQLHPAVSGTFALLDLLFYALGALLAVALAPCSTRSR
jgi:hypothetical protein